MPVTDDFLQDFCVDKGYDAQAKRDFVEKRQYTDHVRSRGEELRPVFVIARQSSRRKHTSQPDERSTRQRPPTGTKPRCVGGRAASSFSTEFEHALAKLADVACITYPASQL